MAERSNVPKHMTVVDGVRVRKDEADEFTARHKAVLAPKASSAAASTSKPRTARGKQTGAGDGQPDN